MLSVIQETKDNFSLIHDDCTIDNSVVQSVVLEFSKKSRFELTDLTPVKANDFVNCDRKVYWTIEKTDELENSNLFNAKYYICKYQTRSITNITEGNIVNGTNILLDFSEIDLIKIGNHIYEIDKKHSDIDFLFLKKPVKDQPLGLPYNPVILSEKCILLDYDILNRINNKIKSLPVCDSCDDSIVDVMCDLFALKRVEDAINCNDCDSAKTIFNSLKNKYNNELC